MAWFHLEKVACHSVLVLSNKLWFRIVGLHDRWEFPQFLGHRQSHCTGNLRVVWVVRGDCEIVYVTMELLVLHWLLFDQKASKSRPVIYSPRIPFLSNRLWVQRGNAQKVCRSLQRRPYIVNGITQGAAGKWGITPKLFISSNLMNSRLSITYFLVA